ncbi:MAG TPA: hypothetical protein VK989_06920 [Polyangia bacterium]|nr:hypothetical protein [Polyangia bacterium]
MLILAPSCGGGGSGDQTTKFVGPWTFSSGELTPTATCPITTSFALKGIAVTFAKVDDSTISLGIGAACTVKFTVTGAKATVEPNQTCTLDFGAPLGAVAVAVKTWTLALSGDTIDNMIVGVAGGFCTASGTAVLTRGAPDAGTHDAATHEGGATETGGDTSPADAMEAGAADGGTSEADASDGGATETGADTSPADANMTEASATDSGAEAGD